MAPAAPSGSGDPVDLGDGGPLQSAEIPAVSPDNTRPKVHGAAQILLFDALWVLGATWVYGAAALAPVSVLDAVYQRWGAVAVAASLPLAWFLFLLGLIAAIGLVATLAPAEPQGMKRVFQGKDFAAFLIRWGLDAYLVPPIRHHVQLLTLTRWLYFRVMGMDLHWSTHISPGARVISPGLITMGPGVYLGEGTYVSAHLSVGDRMLAKRVVIEASVNLGAHANVGPGVHIGARTKVGAMVDIAPDARIGADVHIFPRCHIGMGAVIEDGAMLDPRTYIPSYAHVGRGEHWAGDPGRCVGIARGGKGKAQRRRSGELRAVGRPEGGGGGGPGG